MCGTYVKTFRLPFASRPSAERFLTFSHGNLLTGNFYSLKKGYGREPMYAVNILKQTRINKLEGKWEKVNEGGSRSV